MILNWAICFRVVQARPLRACATILSVAIGVGAIVAVMQSSMATHKRLLELDTAVTRNATLEIISPDRKPFEAKAVESLSRDKFVKAAVPVLRRFTTLFAEDRRVRGELVGVSFTDFAIVRELRLLNGRAHERDGEICIARSISELLDLQIGDSVKFLNPKSIMPRLVTVVGIFEIEGIGAVEDSPIGLVTLKESQVAFRSLNRISSLILKADAPEETDSLAESLSLPTGLEIQKSLASTGIDREMEEMVNRCLQISAAFSIFAAAIIVLNAFVMSVTERRRQIALFRLVGATTTQIRLLFLQESVLLGALGSVLGVLFGIVGGNLMSLGLQTLSGSHYQAIELQVLPLVVALGAGILIAIVGGAYPAWIASRINPLILCSRIEPSSISDMGIAFRVGGVIVGGIAVALYGLVWLNWVPNVLGVISVALLLISCILLLPSLLKPACAVSKRLFSLYTVVESEMACHQVLSNQLRSSLTIGVVFIAICTSIGVGTTIMGVVGNVEVWFSKTVAADFLVRASLPKIDLSDSLSMPLELIEQIKQTDGVESVDCVTFKSVKVNDANASLMVRDFTLYERAPLNLIAGNEFAISKQLQEGSCVVGSVLAHSLSLKSGDSISLTFGGQSFTVQIAGIASDFHAGGNLLVMDRNAAGKLYPIGDTHVLLVRAKPNDAKRVEVALRQVAKESMMIFQSFNDFAKYIRNMTSGVTGGLWALLALCLVISILGVINTLTVNIVEQTREIGLLRIIGMTQNQIAALVVHQTLVFALASTIAGMFIGVLLSVVVWDIFIRLTGQAVKLQVSPVIVFGFGAVAGLFVFLSSILPIRRAQNLDPLIAMREE